MSIQALAQRQTALSTTLRDLNHLSHQLSTLQLTPPAADDTQDYAALRDDLTAELTAALRQAEEDFDELAADVADIAPSDSQPRSRRRPAASDDALRLSTETKRLEEDLRNTRARFRKAQLQSLSNARRASARDRAAHLAALRAAAAAASSTQSTTSSTDASTQNENDQQPRFTDLFATRRPPKRDAQKTDNALLLSASSDVTASLKRTHQLLSDELSRSAFAHETLAESNAALKELSGRYDSFSDLVSRSAGLLGTLLRSQKSDTWFLETAIYILLATLGWLVFRRLLYGPVWWFLYLPLKLVWSVFATVLGVGGAGAGTAASLALRGSSVGVAATGSVAPSAVPSIANANSERRDGQDQDTPVSDRVGTDAEQADAAARAGRVQAGEDQGRDGEAVRGDGARLPPRGNQAGNPMKRDWTEDEDGAKKDEL